MYIVININNNRKNNIVIIIEKSSGSIWRPRFRHYPIHIFRVDWISVHDIKVNSGGWLINSTTLNHGRFHRIMTNVCTVAIYEKTIIFVGVLSAIVAIRGEFYVQDQTKFYMLIVLFNRYAYLVCIEKYICH